MRAGYALWALHDGGWKADDVTTSVAHYLVFDQKAEHWRSSSNRPPSESSPFAATYVALRALAAYGTDSLKQRVERRRKRALGWLIRAAPTETEDRVFRLLALRHLEADPKVVKKAADDVIKAQRKDGGWAQLKDGGSDAYATGSSLFALHLAAEMPTDHEVYQRGLKFLLKRQHPDGSWHVASRSKPFQAYYESGYPHKKDQFISMAAGGWATLALLYALPQRAAEKPGSSQ